MAGGISHRGDASSVGAAAFAPALSIGGAAARLFALVSALVQRMRALRLSSVLVVLGACSLSACGIFQQQTPAPIVEHSYIPGPSETETNEPEEPAPVVTVPEPASAVKPPPAPKPKRRVVKPKPPEPVVTPPPEPPEPPPPPQIISTRLMQHDQLHGLLDAEVQRPDGKVVGRAVDLYVDPSAKPKLLMVNLSGFMGIGDRKVNFPWTAFRFTPNSKTAPITFLPPPPPAKGKPAADPVPKPQPVSEAPSNFMQLVDSTVTQKNGARIGRVVDVLVDSQAQPQALVVDLSSSLAADKRHVAVNWGDLQVVSRNKQLALQMDFNDAQLKAAPTYAPEQPIKIVSPVVAAPASAAAAGGAASGAGSANSGGTTASGAVAAQTPSSGARPAR
ncbi:hypothetical protein [Caballeronia sp. BCC1704]|uniref:hypothetical protein n=1 Tax=Caballeronia sp. BCC1704 TaxID=2676300 RepID=UPI00158AC80B|nr:hypothetical protein [Caballeronia sp. BCC1704]